MIGWRHLKWMIALAALVLPRALGADVGRPTTAPSSPDIAALVAQLGDSDFKVREQASLKLDEIGRPALAAIRQAAKSDDPEVRSRAEMLIKRIEGRPIPLPPPTPGQVNQRSVSVTIADGAKTIDVDEGSRKIQITEKVDGIELTVAGVVEGKRTSQTYKARNADQLKAEQPEAYAIYEQYANVALTPMMPGDVRLPGMGQPVNPNAFWPPALDPLDELEEQLDAQLRKAEIPAEKRWKVMDRLNKARNARDADPEMTQKGRDRQIQEYYTHCDGLRAMLEELKLPVPEHLLPPPAHARLGIQLKLKPNEMGTHDLAVQRVLIGSRAEKIGLKAGDVLLKIGETRIQTPEGLRRALLQNKPPVTVTILRENREMELEERHEGT